jgi:CspA family cold shock protein
MQSLFSIVKYKKIKYFFYRNNKRTKMSTLKGTVKWFNSKKGFGFIEREDKEKDAFVHASAVKDAGLRFLNEGDKIEFELEDGPKGPSAVNLKKID